MNEAPAPVGEPKPLPLAAPEDAIVSARPRPSPFGSNVLSVGTSGYQTVEVSAGTFHELRFHLNPEGGRTRVTWVSVRAHVVMASNGSRALMWCAFLAGLRHRAARHCVSGPVWHS